MAGFFRELAARALAPRGTVHPVSAAPYSPRAGSELPDADVWPGAVSPVASTAVARMSEARTASLASNTLGSRLADDDAQSSDRESATAPVRSAAPEAHATREREPQRAATPPEPVNLPANDAPAPRRTATAASRPPQSAPLRPAAIAARAPTTPAALRVGSRPDTGAAPEVHIHIGRIELTAAPAQAPAKKPRASATRKAMSLDEYLQQRSRGAP